MVEWLLPYARKVSTLPSFESRWCADPVGQGAFAFGSNMSFDVLWDELLDDGIRVAQVTHVPLPRTWNNVVSASTYV